MTVGELRDRLSNYAYDSIVLLPGYEGGVNEVRTVEGVRVHLNVHDEWWKGAHEVADKDAEGEEVVDAVELGA